MYFGSMTSLFAFGFVWICESCVRALTAMKDAWEIDRLPGTNLKGKLCGAVYSRACLHVHLSELTRQSEDECIHSSPMDGLLNNVTRPRALEPQCLRGETDTSICFTDGATATCFLWDTFSTVLLIDTTQRGSSAGRHMGQGEGCRERFLSERLHIQVLRIIFCLIKTKIEKKAQLAAEVLQKMYKPSQTIFISSA